MHYTFIGMSGAGKSHVGRQLAAKLGYDFFDVDVATEARYHKSLQEILDDLGDEAFLEEQKALIKEMEFVGPYVIATGGSVVYTPEVMKYLKGISKIIFIDVPIEIILDRVDGAGRGIVGLRHKTFTQLYEERLPLYRAWADITVPHGATPREIIEQLLTL